MPDKNSAQCLKAELYINKSGVKDDTWIFSVTLSFTLSRSSDRLLLNENYTIPLYTYALC